MNRYMHPRNIYKKPPNFKELGAEYPEFKKFLKADLRGHITIDFKNANALRALTTTLLKKDFQLDVIIPPLKLIPTLPLRLNYIHWIEDLLSFCGIKGEEVCGIDIGTGAVCIYPLLISKKNGWKMIGIESNNDSFKSAVANVERNNLQNKIKVFEPENDNLIFCFPNVAETEFDFIMCNPPFFTSVEDINASAKARKPDRPKPRNAFCASQEEVVTNGGEVDFIKKLIDESKCGKEQVKIYTTKVGHKSSLDAIKKHLREAGVKSFKQTEFCQGHTTRWGLAWTFCNYNLKKMPDVAFDAVQKERAVAKPFRWEIPVVKGQSLVGTSIKVTNILRTLNIVFLNVKSVKCGTILTYIKSKHNTWSHQRRKRREQQRIESASKELAVYTSNLLQQKSLNEQMKANEQIKTNEQMKANEQMKTNEQFELKKQLKSKDQPIMAIECADASDMKIQTNTSFLKMDIESTNSKGSIGKNLPCMKELYVHIPDFQAPREIFKLANSVKRSTINTSFEEKDAKKVKSDSSSDMSVDESNNEVENKTYISDEMYLEAYVCFSKVDGKFYLDLSYSKGSGGKDALYQLLQYIKNNYEPGPDDVCIDCN